MTPEQEVRAAAIQAAAAFCAPIGYAQGGKIHSPEDVLLVADVFGGYIESGWEQALQINASGEKNQPKPQEGEPETPSVQSVELREQEHPVGDILMSFDDDPPTIPRINPAPQAAVAVPLDASPAPAPESQTADVIPLAARGTVGKEQDKARRRIEGVRHERAKQIVQQAKTAKVLEHKERLRESADSAGLADYQMEIDGKLQTVGGYLASL